ncbi:hypothetical protein BGX23_000248 [Mortierella sp. AD031]|nr:hypothetical protein BGX23_000248 [Mortierella sp. AD031]
MLQSAPMSEVLSIPELLDAIQVYLTPHDLVQCTTVSKAFNALFIPILWETVTIKTQAQHLAFTTVPQVQEALARNAHHIRVLHLRSCKSLEPFLQFVDSTQLKLLHTLAFPFWATQTFPQDPPSLEMLVKQADENVLAPPSLVYPPPPPPSQDDDDDTSQEQERMMTLFGFDKLTGQKDWLLARGMFMAQEEATMAQYRQLTRGAGTTAGTGCATPAGCYCCCPGLWIFLEFYLDHDGEHHSRRSHYT